MDIERIERFPSPFAVGTPAGAEGWERMYPYYLLFSTENAAWEDRVFWFQESMHHPHVQPPFDAIIHECIRLALGQYNSRIFAVPPAYGLEQRVLNGYVYFTAVPVTDAQWQEVRASLFTRRAGHYFEHWDELFARWKEKMVALIEALKALDVPALPRVEPEQVVLEAAGVSSGYRLLKAYHALVDNVFLAWQYHFEMLNLGYAAYLNLFEFCRATFRGIRDETISQLLVGLDTMLFRPHQELVRLARLGVQLALEEELCSERPPEAILEAVRGKPRGAEWIRALEAARDPWFCHSCGTGFYHADRSWIDEPSVPFAMIASHVRRILRGEEPDGARDARIRERDRIERELRDALDRDDERQLFDRNLALARRVAGYVEDHNFYVEHWHHTIFWNTVRVFGRRLVEGGVLDDAEDVFLLNRWEVGQALYDLVGSWATGAPSRGGPYWRREVAARRTILDALRAAPPLPALGPVPSGGGEPLTAMLFGITPGRLAQWMAPHDPAATGFSGVPASRGSAVGVARIVRSAADLGTVEDGDVLVCPCLPPSWASVFSRVRAVVSEIGGVMCHAAIVCREYEIPAVLGVSRATRRIPHGAVVRVDGDAGVVRLCDDTGEG